MLIKTEHPTKKKQKLIKCKWVKGEKLTLSLLGVLGQTYKFCFLIGKYNFKYKIMK